MFTIPYNTTLYMVLAIVLGVVGFIIYGLIRGFDNVFREEYQAFEREVSSSGDAGKGNPGQNYGKRPSRKEIMELMEQLKEGETLAFLLPETFGGGFAGVQLNPDPGKKWILKVSKELSTLGAARIYWSHNKAKAIAKWVNDRFGELLNTKIRANR